MLSSCIVTSVGEKYKNLIGDTLNNIPLFINKIIIINDTGETLSLNNGEERIIILDNKESIGLSKSLEKWSKEYYRYDLLFRIDIGDLSKPERFINQYNWEKLGLPPPPSFITVHHIEINKINLNLRL